MIPAGNGSATFEVWRGPVTWLVRSEVFKPLFGSATLPLPYQSTASFVLVLRELRERNPDVTIRWNVEADYRRRDG